MSEGDFGVTRPNASCQSMLALTMWARNGTVEWLKSLSEDKINEVIEEARSQYPAMKQKYEKRKVELKEAKYHKNAEETTRTKG